MKVLGTLNLPEMETSRGQQHVEKASNSKSDAESSGSQVPSCMVKAKLLEVQPIHV